MEYHFLDLGRSDRAGEVGAEFLGRFQYEFDDEPRWGPAFIVVRQTLATRRIITRPVANHAQGKGNHDRCLSSIDFCNTICPKLPLSP